MDRQQPREGSDEDTREHAPTPPEPRTAEDVVRDQQAGGQPDAGQSPPEPGQPLWASPPQEPPAEQAWQQQPPAPPPSGQQWQQPPAGQWQQQPPSQQWQQQPPVQQWQQPPPGQGWQQPPAAQAGWGGYAQQPSYGSSVMVVIAGIVLVIFGGFLTFFAALGLLVGGLIEDAIREQALEPTIPLEGFGQLVAVVAGIALVIGILHLVGAAGIFLHRQWGRVIGILVAALGTLLFVLGLVSTFQATGTEDVALSVVIALGYAFSLFALIAGGRHFQRQY